MPCVGVTFWSKSIFSNLESLTMHEGSRQTLFPDGDIDSSRSRKLIILLPSCFARTMTSPRVSSYKFINRCLATHEMTSHVHVNHINKRLKREAFRGEQGKEQFSVLWRTLKESLKNNEGIKKKSYPQVPRPSGLLSSGVARIIFMVGHATTKL